MPPTTAQPGARPNIATRAGREAAAQADRMARPVIDRAGDEEFNDPFAQDDPPFPNPGPARARAAVVAAEQPEVMGRPRAAAYAPKLDNLFLRDVEGMELEIYTITMGEDQFGACADMLVALEGDVDNMQTVRASGFAAKTLAGVLDKVEAGEVEWPLAARFDQIAIAGGKSCWKMS